jgi:hypothetical protein
MGYFSSGGSTGGSDHTHPNKGVLDQLTSAGSGQVITTQERTAIGAYAGGANEISTWSGMVPATTDEAIARIARLLKQHLGTQIPE